MTKEALDMLEHKRGLKDYSKPQLIEYGRVEEITKGATGSIQDYGNLQPGK